MKPRRTLRCVNCGRESSSDYCPGCGDMLYSEKRGFPVQVYEVYNEVQRRESDRVKHDGYEEGR